MPYALTDPRVAFATIDPTDAFKDVDPNRLVEACGLIPMWFDHEDERPYKEQIETAYGFGSLYEWDMDKASIDPDGTYHYEGDPDMKPYMKWERDGEVAYMYECAIIAFLKEGEKPFVSRVD